MEAITPKRRIRDLRKAAADFSAHLSNSPGMILTPKVRLGVTICARDALLAGGGYPEALANRVCPFRLYSYVAHIKDKPAFPAPPTKGPTKGGNDSNQKMEVCLRNIIHAVVNFQSKLDARWYEDAVSDLKSCGALSNYAKEHGCSDSNADLYDEEMDLAARAAFCEVILLSAISHCVHVTFLVLGEDIPPLPSWEAVKKAPGPSNVRFSSLLRRVRRDDTVAGAPYFVGRDILRTSPEYSKIDQGVWRELESLLSAECPFICGVFSPPDLLAYYQVCHKSYYLTLDKLFLDWNDLDSHKHCAPATRFDIETVAKSVAAAQLCDF